MLQSLLAVVERFAGRGGDMERVRDREASASVASAVLVDADDGEAPADWRVQRPAQRAA